jgi:hypothetical protein
MKTRVFAKSLILPELLCAATLSAQTPTVAGVATLRKPQKETEAQSPEIPALGSLS